VITMAKMTKTQAKNMAMSIKSKAAKLFTIGAPNGAALTVKDFNDINKIIERFTNKLK